MGGMFRPEADYTKEQIEAWKKVCGPPHDQQAQLRREQLVRDMQASDAASLVLNEEVRMKWLKYQMLKRARDSAKLNGDMDAVLALEMGSHPLWHGQK